MPFPQKFTQGEWTAFDTEKRSVSIHDEKRRLVAEVAYDRCCIPEAEGKYNARLIAAAPKLVQAAIAAWEHAARHCKSFQTDGHCCGGCPMADLEEAIHLATDGNGREAYLRDVSVRVTCHLPEKRD